MRETPGKVFYKCVLSPTGFSIIMLGDKVATSENTQEKRAMAMAQGVWMEVSGHTLVGHQQLLRHV